MNLGVLGFLLGVVLGCGGDTSGGASGGGEPGEPEPAHEVEVVAESLQVVDLEAIEAMIAQTSQDGRVLVIDFWATWCVPCVEMFPELHEGLMGYGDRVRAVTVTLDDPSREAEARAFLAEHDAIQDAYRFVSDSQAQQALVDGLGERWTNLSVPAILVYNPQGELAGEFLDGGTTGQILARVDELLASDVEDQP